MTARAIFDSAVGPMGARDGPVGVARLVGQSRPNARRLSGRSATNAAAVPRGTRSRTCVPDWGDIIKIFRKFFLSFKNFQNSLHLFCFQEVHCFDQKTFIIWSILILVMSSIPLKISF